MERICERCGTVLDNPVKFCTECGANVEMLKTEQNQPAPRQQPQSGPMPQPRPQPNNQDKTTKVVGMAAYFGMILLFAIPIVGFIACILMAFLPKNKNVKNFSRATLIWLIIGMIISGISVAIISKTVIDMANKVTQYVKTIDTVGEVLNAIGQAGDLADSLEAFSEGGSATDVLNELDGLFNQGGNGELEDSLDQLGIGELGDTLDQFGNGELGDTLEQLENGDWEGILNQLEDGGMEDILNSFGNGEFILE